DFSPSTVNAAVKPARGSQLRWRVHLRLSIANLAVGLVAIAAAPLLGRNRHIVGLFRCARPALGGIDKTFSELRRRETALAEHFRFQSLDAEFLSVNTFRFHKAIAEHD